MDLDVKSLELATHPNTWLTVCVLPVSGQIYPSTKEIHPLYQTGRLARLEVDEEGRLAKVLVQGKCLVGPVDAVLDQIEGCENVGQIPKTLLEDGG
jgi:hypothetical protein